MRAAYPLARFVAESRQPDRRALLARDLQGIPAQPQFVRLKILSRVNLALEREKSPEYASSGVIGDRLSMSRPCARPVGCSPSSFGQGIYETGLTPGPIS